MPTADGEAARGERPRHLLFAKHFGPAGLRDLVEIVMSITY